MSNMKPVSGKYIITNVGIAPQFANRYQHLPSQDGWRNGFVVIDITAATNNDASEITICNFPQSSTIVSEVFRTRKEARAFLDEVLVKAGA